MVQHTIVNVGYRSTNYWVVSAERNRLLVDLGWPGMFGRLRAELQRKRVALDEICYGLATHYHIDHAGAAEDLKRAGVPLLLIDVQVDAVAQMARWVKPHDNYTPITPHGNRIIACADSRALLATIGLAGEIVHTPGHSDDSISLLLDDGSVFTGDLTWPAHVGVEDRQVVAASWRHLAARGARRVYGGHGDVVPLDAIYDPAAAAP